VDRDPLQIEADLRRYLQHALLARATRNKAFAHVMVPRFTFIDPLSGRKVDEPDLNYMASIEAILTPDEDSTEAFRQEVAQKFLDLQSSGDLVLESDKAILTSRNDNLLQCFSKEYAQLLSHRKVDDEIDPELLSNAFFQKLNDPEAFERAVPAVRQFVERILQNMRTRYRYPNSIALATIVFALRKGVIDFRNILS